MSITGRRARVVGLAGTPAARALGLALVLGAAIAAVLVALLADRPSSSAHLIDDPVTIKRALSPTTVLFGDALEAEIDVYSNDESVAARSVRVSTDFEPYRIATTRVNRESQGGVSLLRTRFSLECLTRDCLPPKGGARVITFPPAAVTYREGGRDVRIPVSFEPLQLSSRLPQATTSRVGIVDATPPLDPRLGRSPETLRILLLLAAVVLGLAGATLAIAGLWPSSFLAKRRRRSLSPLERSLQRVEAAARGDDEPARRRTLDDLATRLGDVPSLTLELQARALAWGQRPPEPEALTLLANQVRTTLNGRSRG